MGSSPLDPPAAGPEGAGTHCEGRPVPSLEDLGPRYREQDHSPYVELLVGQLTGRDDGRRNIALAGHYGSGKSSVLAEVERRLAAAPPAGSPWKRPRRAITVSLSSLGTSAAPTARVTEGGAPPALTNFIEKEIVKQLLYRERPSRMRSSRYARTEAFRPWAAVIWAAAIAVGGATVAVVSRFPTRFNEALPEDLATGRDWLGWAMLAVLVAGGVWIVWAAMRALHNRVRLEKLSAGPAVVALSNENNTYFDEYLDEIVYFFEVSRTSVVFFEDLDRFNDPHIFEALRELNAVLNNAQQVSAKPVRFVYAIRDSVFESIPRLGEMLDDDVSASTRRTKFFDVVIPIVPFISHRNAQELVKAAFTDLEVRPGDEVIDLVAPHLTDMRLVKNIRNEFAVFAQQILPPAGPEGLDADCLFAMLVYKNLHLADFEKVREGRSSLDAVYRTYRTLVGDTARAAENRARGARQRLADLDDAPQNASLFGERLGSVLAALADAFGVQKQLSIGGRAYSLKDAVGPDFWQSWASSRASLRFQSRWGALDVSADSLETLLGFELSEELWAEQSREAWMRELSTARELKDEVARATLAAMMRRSDPVTLADGKISTLRDVAEDKLDRLTVDLISRGYLLDENYTLYVAKFQFGRLSRRAMNFILHAVQPNITDVRFRLAEVADIDAIVVQEGERLLNGRAVFNIDIFDHLLVTDPDKLASAISRISDGTDDALEFIDAYLADGREPGTLISLITPRWPGVMTYLAEQHGLPGDLEDTLLSAALGAASPSMRYDTSTVLQRRIETGVGGLEVLTSAEATADPSGLIAVLASLGVTLPDLSVLSPGVRSQAIAHSLYPVTEVNLRAAIDRDAPLRLDVLKAVNTTVYEHALANISDYLAIVGSRDESTISGVGRFLEILLDVLTFAREQVAPVIERSEPGLEVADLEDADPGLWPTLVATGRIAATVGNVLAYSTAKGFDLHLVPYLESLEEIAAVGITGDEATTLAVDIANESALSASTRLRLVMGLAQVADLTLDSLEPSASPLLSGLVQAGVLPDVASNFAFVSSADWPVKRALMISSSRFAGYLPDLDLTVDDVHGICADPELPEVIRVALVDSLPVFEDVLDQDDAHALARWAEERRHEVDVESIGVLTRKGVPGRDVVRLLEPHLSTLGLDVLAPLLDHLGEPYSELTITGDGHHLKIPTAPGHRELLERLEGLGTVSSYSEDRRGFLRVHRVRVRDGA